jgi:hypothetical protein
MRNISRIGIIVLPLFIGCGGSEPPPDEAAFETQSVGEENPATEQTPSEGQPGSTAQGQPTEAAPVPAGPASVIVNVTVKGQPIAASIQLLDEGGKVAVEGKAGEKLSLNSGKYQAVVQVTDEKGLADKPTKRLTVELQPGQEAKEQLSLPWARIRLNVKVNGQATSNARVTLMREGVTVATVKSADQDYVQISPGRYQAEVLVRNTKVTVDNVMFPEGATQDVPVNVKF